MITRARHVGLTTLLTSLLCLAAAPQAHAQKYRVVDLGRGGAFGINSQGAVLGTTFGEGGQHATVWSPSGMPTLTGEWPGDTDSGATHLNDQGTVLGASGHVVTFNQYQYTVSTPFVWNPSTGLQAYPWKQAHPDARPTALNNLGHVALVGVQSNGSSQVMLWRSPTDFTYVVGNAAAVPGLVKGLNDQDQLIGQAGSAGPLGSEPAYFWSPSTGYLNIPSPSRTFSNISATTLNAQGQVGGYLQDPKTGRTKLFSWTARNGTTVLMPLTSYEGTLSPIGIDKSYRVVGNREHFGPDRSSSASFVWTILGGLKDLNTQLVDNGTASAPVAKVTRATQVNSQGQIAAHAVINGQVHAVRLDPVR